MTKPQSDPDLKKEWDLQLDAELEGTFPASDPLKIARFPVETHELHVGTGAPTLSDNNGSRTRGRGQHHRKNSVSKMIAADRVRLKRAYESPASDDGIRILIDRLWPRGVKKANAAIDEWMKEIAPSTELRKWFGHDPERWPEFRRRYRSEIRQHPDEFKRLREFAQHGQLTLVYSAHDSEHNDAVVLRSLLLGEK